MKNSKLELVVKSNELIQASYSLSLTEQRLILLAIIEARETGTGITASDFLTVKAESYASQFDTTQDAAYKALKEAALTLFERQVSIYSTDEVSKKPRRSITRWVSTISYVEGSGKIELIFAPLVVPEIIRLEANFTSYELEQVAGLKRDYAFRLDELLIQWRSIGKVPTLQLEKLRSQLGLSPHEHKAMCDFKKRVLDLSISQINEHTDISVSYEQHKEGRNITGFTFQFKQKKAMAVSKAKKTTPLIERISKAEIEALARPGESYEQAATRLRQNRLSSLL